MWNEQLWLLAWRFTTVEIHKIHLLFRFFFILDLLLVKVSVFLSLYRKIVVFRILYEVEGDKCTAFLCRWKCSFRDNHRLQFRPHLGLQIQFYSELSVLII